jgi:hypothetical protein
MRPRELCELEAVVSLLERHDEEDEAYKFTSVSREMTCGFLINWFLPIT